MSWDIYIQDFPQVKTVAEIPDDYRPQAMGTRAELIARIREVIPGVDFSKPYWGDFEGPGFSIEFAMGESEACTSITLIIRGGGQPVPLVAALLDRLKVRGIDCQTSEFFDTEAAKKSFGDWQKYRDQVLGYKPSKQSPTE